MNPLRRLLPGFGLAAVGLYLVFVPLVLVFVRGWSGYDLARVLQLPVLLVAALGWLARGGVEGPRDVAGRTVLAGMAALALAATLAAPVPAMAMRELATVLGLVAVAALVASIGPRIAAASAVAVVASGIYATVVLAIAIVTALGGEVTSRIDLFVGYDNHRFFSHVLTVAMPLVLVATCPASGLSSGWRFAAGCVLVLQGALVFATGGRGTMLSLAVASGCIGLVCGRSAWPVLRRLGGALLLGLLVFGVLFVVPAWLAGPASQGMADYGGARLTSDQARFGLWQRALDMALASPWWGSGPMHYAHGAGAKAAAPHNLPLQVAAEWGLPMLLLLCTLAVRWARRLARRLRAPDDPTLSVGIVLALGVIAAVVDALFAGTFVMPVSQVWIAVLFGALCAWGSGRLPATPGPGRWSLALPMLVLLAQCGLIVQVLPEARDIGAHLRQVMHDFPSERTQPRFWSHGRF